MTQVTVFLNNDEPVTIEDNDIWQNWKTFLLHEVSITLITSGK